MNLIIVESDVDFEDHPIHFANLVVHVLAFSRVMLAVHRKDVDIAFGTDAPEKNGMALCHRSLVDFKARPLGGNTTHSAPSAMTNSRDLIPPPGSQLRLILN